MLKAAALCLRGHCVVTIPHTDPALGSVKRAFISAVLSNPHNSSVSLVAPIPQIKRLRLKDLPTGMELTHGRVET